MNPSKFYVVQLEKQNERMFVLSKKSNWFSTFRVVAFMLFISVIIYELNERALQPAILLTLVLVIILGRLIKFHNKVKVQLAMAVNSMKLLTLEVEKQNGNFGNIDGGNEFANDNHPYSSDLDLFGSQSIFQFINQTTSFFGKQKLADWLLNKPPKEETIKRQKAAKELSENQSWCFEYRAIGISESIESSQVSSFKKWLLLEPRLLGNRFLKLAIIVLPGIIVFIAVGAFVYEYTYSFTIPFLILSMILLGRQHKYAAQTGNDTFKALATLKVLAYQLTVIEQSTFNSEYLSEIRKSIASTQNACKEINKLHQLLDNLQARNGMVHPFVNIPFMLDIRWLIKLEEWKIKNANHVENWFESLAKTESLISLSGLYFNHQSWITPSFSDAGNTNLITGPNMAGKSTFLRTVAANWVFAQIGAPVRAKDFVINPTAQVFTAMRVKDNLSESVSSFYAELDRIKQLVDRIKSGEQCLYFLDEILKGTNSADRHKGAEALIRQLHKLQASGFISTHDLELGELASKESFVKNFSFESDIYNGKITFDYIIKEGICSSFNACELMRQMGIEVE